MEPANPEAVLLMNRLERLATYRKTWESHWQEIADYVIPRKADITQSRTPGDKRMEKVFDGTAIHAAELLSASIHGMLTNPSTTWFDLRYLDDELNTDDESKEYLETVTDIMLQEFQRSNFGEQIHELYHDLVTFGTGVLFIDDAPPPANGGIRFNTRHISECYLSEDEYGRVDTIFRKFKLTVRAIVKQFGEENVGQKIRDKLKQDPYQDQEIVHVVMPRDDRDMDKVDAGNMAFASIYIEPEQKLILRESGYRENPYCCPRWCKASFEQGYGRSVSMVALPDTKMINTMSQTTIRAAQKQVDPALMVPDDGFILPIRTRPGGLNFYRSGSRDRIEPLSIGSNAPLGLNIEEQRRSAIRSAYYVDQLLMGQPTPGETATSAMIRNEERMRLLGPVMGRLQHELLQPMVERVFNLLVAQDAFPEPPVMVEESGFSVEYVSPIAKAQRTGEAQGIMRLFELMSPLASVDPSVFDHLDMDGLVRHMIKVLSIPAKVTNGEFEVAARRDERQAQEQQQQQMMEAQQTAQSLGAVAPAIKALQQSPGNL